MCCRIQRCDTYNQSLTIKRPAALPKELHWAAGNKTIAAALSRCAYAMEKTARAHIAPRVRARVETDIDASQGESMGLSLAWLKPMVDDLNDAEAAAARLALLTALSPIQISDGIIDAYKSYHRNDASLIMTVAWSAFRASTHVAGWLADKSGYFGMRELPLAS